VCNEVGSVWGKFFRLKLKNTQNFMAEGSIICDK